jgi:prepilin-type N-terminal cleavage/methylation domain-containing protein
VDFVKNSHLPAYIIEMKLIRTKNLNRGFSLIELLVSIGIMGVLSSISLPVLAQAKAKAHRISCVSNLRQIGTGFVLFGGENDDRLPWNLTLRGIGSHFVKMQMTNPNVQQIRMQTKWAKNNVLGIDPNVSPPNNVFATPDTANVIFSLPVLKRTFGSAKMLHSPCDPTQDEYSEQAGENWDLYDAKNTPDWASVDFNAPNFIPKMAISYVLVRGGDLLRPSTVLATTRNLSGPALESSEWLGVDALTTSIRSMAGLKSSQGNLVMADGSASQSKDSDIGPMGTVVNDHIKSRGGKSIGPARTNVFGLD